MEFDIEDGGPTHLILEDASDEEDEICPHCEGFVWFRLIAAYRIGCCYVLFCAGCGRIFQKKWTILP